MDGFRLEHRAYRKSFDIICRSDTQIKDKYRTIKARVKYINNF